MPAPLPVPPGIRPPGISLPDLDTSYEWDDDENFGDDDDPVYEPDDSEPDPWPTTGPTTVLEATQAPETQPEATRQYSTLPEDTSLPGQTTHVENTDSVEQTTYREPTGHQQQATQPVEADRPQQTMHSQTTYHEDPKSTPKDQPPPTTITLPAFTTFYTTRTKHTTTTVSTVPLSSAEAAPTEVPDLPQHCFVDGEALRLLDKHERKECDEQLRGLVREDQITWTRAILPPQCYPEDPWVVPEFDQQEFIDCTVAVRGLNDDERHVWAAGMLPQDCPYTEGEIDDWELDHDTEKDCKKLRKKLNHSAFPPWYSTSPLVNRPMMDSMLCVFWPSTLR